ncbi:MAG: hypothetical protein R3F17_07765, partial [Planctomycetota bacterium]
MKYSLLAGLCLLASPALAQNTCSSAETISGTGSWTWYAFGPHTAFDAGSPCYQLDGYTDHFFQWTAAADGSYLFDTLGSTLEAAISVYSGTGCTATCLEADFGSLHLPGFYPQSAVVVGGVHAGDTYLVRVNVLPDSHTPTGALRISSYDTACLAAPADALEPNNGWDQASRISDGLYLGLSAGIGDPDVFEICLPPGGAFTAQTTFDHTQGNLILKLYERSASYTSTFGLWADMEGDLSSNKSMTHMNTSGYNRSYLLVVTSDGQLNDCNTYDIEFTGTENCALGFSSFCDPANVNSTGLPTILTGSQLASPPGALHLEATQGPPNQFAYLLVGTGLANPA